MVIYILKKIENILLICVLLHSEFNQKKLTVYPLSNSQRYNNVTLKCYNIIIDLNRLDQSKASLIFIKTKSPYGHAKRKRKLDCC